MIPPGRYGDIVSFFGVLVMEIPQGGAKSGRERLRRFVDGSVSSYARTRNDLDGSVSGLSPWIRHGALMMSEVRDAVVGKIGIEASAKFVSELGWRDYWQRVYVEIGDGIWRDLRPGTTGLDPSAYQDELPPEVVNATSGLACMDSFSRELVASGNMHNHARMWFASWVVHWLRVKWQAGARFFLTHLLDADIASNNLSWQWVAGTFSSKPYIFNRENLERFSGGQFCGNCAARDCCPFDATYEELEKRLFPPRGR